MEENLDGKFPLQVVADRVSLSCAHFSRGFRQSTGLAPHQWLIRARIEQAQKLMIETSGPLADIALRVGFSDQTHLPRSFSKMVGTSPGAWRWSHCADAAGTTHAAAVEG
jgi:transcriptional regulator GlxA family with amidase domain